MTFENFCEAEAVTLEVFDLQTGISTCRAYIKITAFDRVTKTLSWADM